MWFEEQDLCEDNRILDEQFHQLDLALDAINQYVSTNMIEAELLQGENLINLTNYVLYGEIAGDDERVHKLGDAILDQVGKNGNKKFRKPEVKDEDITNEP